MLAVKKKKVKKDVSNSKIGFGVLSLRDPSEKESEINTAKIKAKANRVSKRGGKK